MRGSYAGIRLFHRYFFFFSSSPYFFIFNSKNYARYNRFVCFGRSLSIFIMACYISFFFFFISFLQRFSVYTIVVVKWYSIAAHDHLLLSMCSITIDACVAGSLLWFIHSYRMPWHLFSRAKRLFIYLFLIIWDVIGHCSKFSVNQFLMQILNINRLLRRKSHFFYYLLSCWWENPSISNLFYCLHLCFVMSFKTICIWRKFPICCQ